jgi:hypothetical protein
VNVRGPLPQRTQTATVTREAASPIARGTRPRSVCQRGAPAPFRPHIPRVRARPLQLHPALPDRSAETPPITARRPIARPSAGFRVPRSAPPEQGRGVPPQGLGSHNRLGVPGLQKSPKDDNEISRLKVIPLAGLRPRGRLRHKLQHSQRLVSRKPLRCPWGKAGTTPEKCPG